MEFSDGFELELIWSLFGVHLEFIWSAFCVWSRVKLQYNSKSTPTVELIWSLFGVHLEFIWSLFGVFGLELILSLTGEIM